MADHLRPDKAAESATGGELAGWVRTSLETRSARLLGRGYQASVFLCETPQGALVIKQAHRSALLGGLGRAALRREHRAYERLRGVAGVPRSFGLVDDRCLVLQYVAGQSLHQGEARLENRQRFYERLLESIEAMHEAGVAHGDLKRKANILVGPGERPYVIDFGIARLRDERMSWWSRWLFDWFKQSDYNAWVKLKYRRRLRDLSPVDRERYRPLLLERVARSIRIPAQKVTLRRLRKRLQQRR